jgi:hypothetical protein
MQRERADRLTNSTKATMNSQTCREGGRRHTDRKPQTERQTFKKITNRQKATDRQRGRSHRQKDKTNIQKLTAIQTFSITLSDYYLIFDPSNENPIKARRCSFSALH